ncbi:hypothetical protein GGR26_001928 [Lewinella marina]|uniref:Uncharacterized protein n=1 Tax=Neolewinella marina TaxID=438751 RepID=A0A2G0CHA9_9BACT|nr:BT4734/BF3469 family protein [Neolewinella marina]NJB86160.1 hypothetical protein [Neolewinella marina]PHK99362.1 hypothetical protein CGL56_07885 [Neolewinella marina]
MSTATDTSVLNVLVSSYPNVLSTNEAKTINLLTWLTSDKHRGLVEAIRAEADPTRQKKMKKELPLVTVSGTFSDGRKDEDLLQHSGLICLDIDADDNPHLENWDVLDGQLRNLANAAYVGRSVRGNGYMVIVPIKYPQLHQDHFDALKSWLLTYGIRVDSACRNVARARFYSYDPDAYFNHHAPAFDGFPEAPKLCVITTPRTTEEERVKVCVDAVEQSQIDIAPSYLDWFGLARSLAAGLGEGGRGYFHRLSRFYPKYRHGQADKQFDAALRSPGSATLGTLFALCADHGIRYKDLTPTPTHKFHQRMHGQAVIKPTEKNSQPSPPQMPAGWSRNQAGELLDADDLPINAWYANDDLKELTADERAFLKYDNQWMPLHIS